METIKSLLDASEKILAAICVMSFATMFVLGVVTVLFRFVIQSSLAFPDEMIRYLFVWLIALGSAIGIRRNIHAAIGLLVKAMPGALQRISLIVASLCSVVFFLILIQKGYNVTTMEAGQISPALEVSMAWVYSAIPVGAVFGLLYTIELLFHQLMPTTSDLVIEDR